MNCCDRLIKRVLDQIARGATVQIARKHWLANARLNNNLAPEKQRELQKLNLCIRN